MSKAVGTASITSIWKLIHYGGNAKKGYFMHFAAQRQTEDVCLVLEWLLHAGCSLHAVIRKTWLGHGQIGPGLPSTLLHAEEPWKLFDSCYPGKLILD